MCRGGGRLMPRRVPDSAGVADQSAVGPRGLFKRGLQRIFKRFGYQIMRFPAPHSHERHIRRLLSTLAVNCVLDVGAHEGEFYQLLRQTGYGGRVVSFEPVPDSFARLQRVAAGDPHWRGYNVALGREAGTLPINVPDSTMFASFLRPNDYCQERFPHAHWDGRTESVRVERLESLYAEFAAGIERPRVFLKMDTQGWDRDVLAGAGRHDPNPGYPSSETREGARSRRRIPRTGSPAARPGPTPSGRPNAHGESAPGSSRSAEGTRRTSSSQGR